MSNGVREVPVRDLDQLIHQVTPRRPDPHSGRLRSQCVFRGGLNRKWQLLTSLDSLGTPITPPHAKGHLEEHLFRNFMRYSRPHLPIQPINDWEFLVVAQHYGLPTRLLDWSRSPLVAAHFATDEGDPAEDRVIWQLDWRMLHERFGLPDRALTVEDLDSVLGAKGVKSLWDLFSNPANGRKLFVCMLEPPALDARIVAQAAALTLCSDKTRPLDVVLADVDLIEALTRLIVPAEAVPLVRDQLDLCGVDERRLFPDLHGVTAQMRRYYSSSAAEAAEFTKC